MCVCIHGDKNGSYDPPKILWHNTICFYLDFHVKSCCTGDFVAVVFLKNVRKWNENGLELGTWAMANLKFRTKFKKCSFNIYLLLI